MGVLRHRALALFLLCVSLTSLCVLLLPSQRGSRLHKMVKETVSRELSHVIQSDSRRAEDHSLLAASPTLLSLLGSVKLSRSLYDLHTIADTKTSPQGTDYPLYCKGNFPKGAFGTLK